MLDQRTQQFLDNIIKGASNEELFAASRLPANVEVQDQTTVEADAKVRPLEFDTGYKFKSDATKPYVDNVNRALENRQQDKEAFSANAADAYKKRQEQEINLGNIVRQAEQAKTPYQRPEELKMALAKAQQDASQLQKMPEQDLATQAILSFAPALFGAIGGESAAISQVEGGKKAREIVSAQRKEQQESIKSQNEQVMKKYEQLVKIDSGLADDWLARQKLDTDQARLGADVMKFSAGMTDKDIARAEQLASQASRDSLTGSLKGAEQAMDIEGEPAKEAAKNKRASIVAQGLGMKEAGKLRNEFEDLPEVKSFRQMQPAYDKLVAISKDPSPAGDISMVYSYMKMQDPNSAILPGEYATAEKAAGVPDRVRNLYNKLLTGEFLSDKQRKDFANQGKNIYNAQQVRVAQREKDYKFLAGRSGTDPKNVIPTDTEQVRSQPKTLPAVDQQALDWANKNPKSEKSAQIKESLKRRGLL